MISETLGLDKVVFSRASARRLEQKPGAICANATPAAAAMRRCRPLRPQSGDVGKAENGHDRRRKVRAANKFPGVSRGDRDRVGRLHFRRRRRPAFGLTHQRSERFTTFAARHASAPDEHVPHRGTSDARSAAYAIGYCPLELDIAVTREIDFAVCAAFRASRAGDRVLSLITQDVV